MNLLTESGREMFLSASTVILLNAVVFFLLGLESLLDLEADRKVGYFFLSISLAVIITTFGVVWWGSS
ncbi:hypothetical protein H0266_14880 [Halobacillus locisalis]|uniref:Uncharacterized protein n=1 Tax=Halobacillus locisalis TaxID=220753 RepID=A0A838CWG4_9BACI|nr:hypothetical protein [Halobacillus locisalis]MBA2176179.1 hypothetical protein [Halobacillus locisalis]